MGGQAASTSTRPNDAESLGITTIYQDLALCDNLDIVQNMFLGHETLRHGLLDESAMEIAAREILSRPPRDDRCAPSASPWRRCPAASANPLRWPRR